VRQVLADISVAWRSPGAAVRAIAARGPGEEILLGYLMFGCLISFAVSLPDLVARSPEIAEGARATGVAAGFVGALIFAPLFFYGLAAVSHLAARASGGKASWREARLALFFATLAVQPLAVIVAILGLAVPQGPVASALSVILALAFLRIWLGGLYAVERR
jgi:hypothetical protein